MDANDATTCHAASQCAVSPWRFVTTNTTLCPLMGRLQFFLLFVLLVTLVVGAVHYYVWQRLAYRLALAPPLRRGLRWVMMGLFGNLLLSIVTRRILPQALVDLWATPSLVWLGVIWLLLASLLLADGVTAAVWLWSRTVAGPVDPTRRHALSRLLGFAATAMAGGASVASCLGAERFRSKRIEPALERLPAALDGLTIVQVTDVHVGPTLGRAFVEEVVRRVNELEPDIIAITGDLVDGSVKELADAVAPLAALNARLGTYFVTGNHEYYSGAVEWCEHLVGLGLRVLRNERVALQYAGAMIEVAGVDDFHAERYGHGHGANLRRALNGRDPGTPVVLLAHQPRAAHEANQFDVDLQLSGHTHGGQLWPFSWLVRLQQPVVSGLGRVGRTQVYVSNGTGYWGPPMRLLAPAEITQVVLRKRA
jgi:uncharacterized protein